MRFLVPCLSPRPDPQPSSGYLVPGFSEPVSLLEKKRASPDDGNGAGREDRLGAQDIAPVGAPPSSHQCAWVPVPGRLVHTAQQPAGAGVGAARGGGVAFVPDAGARRALGLFPRHFPVTFQRGGQFRGGPCPLPTPAA